MDKMREEFETWFNGEYGYFPWRSKFDGDDYATTLASSTWEGWKASRASLRVELPENCKGMALTVDEFHSQLDKAGISHK